MLCNGHKIDENHPLIIYNKDKSLVGFIIKELNAAIYRELVEAVKTKGWKGSHAFFYAITEKSESDNNNETNVKINTSRILTVESW